MENEITKISEQMEKYGKIQNVMRYINKETLRKEHERQDGKKATGIDGITKSEYAEQIGDNLDKLMQNMKNMSYKPKAVKRIYIPKEGKQEKRALGIPAYEDKLVQGVMANILNEIYENIFLDCSYGFRPNRSCHKAVKELDKIIMNQKVNYVVDADIKGFFTNVNHEWMIKFLRYTIQDKRFIQYIVRILKSGIMEQMQYYESDKGTPQGGLISPILANIYLHYVLDLWFEKEIKKKCKGEAYLIRYCDDFVCCFELREEAEKFYEVLQKRLNKFNLELAEDKSRIIAFGRNSHNKEKFDFLGFTHINGKSRKGKYKLIHHTSKKKTIAKRRKIKEWIKEKVNIYKIPYLIKQLNIKLQGMYRYYGISDNYQWMAKIRKYTIDELYKLICRRSQRGKISWETMHKIIEYNPIVEPKIYYPIW